VVARHHLFVAVTPTAFGEVLHGRRLAEALVAAGDRVSFIAPSEVQPALAGAPVRRGVLERLGTTVLDELLHQLAASEPFDSMCLVDLAAVALTFGLHALPFAAVRNAHRRVVALDLWSLAETDRVFDFGDQRVPLPADVLDIPHIVPVPFARPDVHNGYDAWPRNQPLTPAQRAAVRQRMGLAPDERVVVLPTATWQTHAHQLDATTRASALAVPPLLLARIARSGATLVHVGPAAWAPPSAHYRHVAQLPPDEFQQLIGAADAVLTTNLSATTIATALAADVPVVAVTCDGGDVAPFRVWPLGLCGLLAPVLAGNPLLACVRVVDLFDEAGFAAAFEPDPRWLERVRSYRAQVAALPGPAARYAELL
jgi:Family of unknown function (DUF6365)